MQKRSIVYLAIYPFAVAVDAIAWQIAKFSLYPEFFEARIGSLTLFGSARLHSSAQKAIEQIKRIDPELHQQLLRSQIVLAEPWKDKKRRSVPISSEPRARYCINDWMIDDGIDSTIFGIVAFYYRYRAMTESPLTARILSGSVAWKERGFHDTKAWMCKHEYSLESVGYLEKVWHDWKLNNAYQDASHNGRQAPA